MYAKLAVRNVKRQLGNYLIYFVTVSFTIALMFALNTCIYSKELQNYLEDRNSMRISLTLVSIVVALITAFVLSYATSYMLKLRSKEFGLYLTLGMTRKNILNIFIIENILLSVLAFSVGIVAGLFLYQGLMALLAYLLDINIALSSYSFNGLVLTIIISTGMLIISILTSIKYLKRVSIYELLHDEKQEKTVSHPLCWTISGVISLIIIICSILYIYKGFQMSYKGENFGALTILIAIAILTANVFVFHVSLSRGLINILLNNKSRINDGCKIFVLRQISGKITVNSILIGSLSLLITLAVICSNTSFCERISELGVLNHDFVFDAMYIKNIDSSSPISNDEGEKIINRYNTINSKFSYSIKKSGRNDLYSHTKYSGNEYENLTDSFMSLSDFNTLLKRAGKKTINLNDDEFVVICNSSVCANSDFSSVQLELNNTTLHFKQTYSDYPLFSFIYMYAVIPDKAIVNMSPEINYTVYDLEKEHYETKGLCDNLSYKNHSDDGYDILECDYIFREAEIRSMNATSGVIIISMLYISAVFICMALTILSLKVLSGLIQDRRRYEILYKLGADKRARKTSLLLQLLVFFLLPFLLPVILNVPAGILIGKLFIITGYSSLYSSAILTSMLIMAAITLIFLLYFVITYKIAHDNIFSSKYGR